MPAAIPIAGAVAGSVVSGAMNKSGSGGSQTVDKSPWAPAQPFLQDLIKDGQSLYGHYQQNPFSDQQKTAFQNQFTMQDQYNNQVLPGLLKGFQGLLGSQFGDISSGLLGGLQGAQQRQMANAPQTGENGKAAQYAPSSYGLLNFASNQLSPWTNSLTPNAVAAAKAIADETPEQRKKREEEEYYRMMMYHAAGAGDGSAGVGVGGAGDAAAAGAASAGGGVSI